MLIHLFKKIDMAVERLTKKQIKLVARIWVGSMIRELDGGFTEGECGIQDHQIYGVVSEARRIGHVILKNHPSFSDLNEIVEYVKQIKN